MTTKPIVRFKPFDVVAVPFPYADRAAEKRRPAVVVSAPEVEREHGLIWLAMITSADNPSWPCDIAIADLTAAGLPHASVVRPVKIATVEAARATHLGRLAPAARAKLAAALRGRLARND